MLPVELTKGVYWVGAIDWSLRSFHGYTTMRGATYNAYLIVDEKIALIDAVKAPFAQELLDRVSKIVPLEKIDYLVSNHVEMDHSGAIPRVLALAPRAKVVTSQPQGLKGLTLHYGPHDYVAVKAGDTLSLGSRSLRFVPTPMVHWPDNMFTYCPEEKILFSNDSFGQHYASSGRFDDTVDLSEVMQEAAKYYANIVMPYASQVKGLFKSIEGLEVKLIAPSHGIVWRSHIDEILSAYAHWSDNAPANRAVVAFDSMWHSTEAMARAVAEGFIAAGIPTVLRDINLTHISDIMTDVLEAKFIALGSPTLNNNLLPTVAGFLTYFRGLAPKARLGMAFGSYGWSGQSIAQAEEGLIAAGVTPFCPMQRVQYVPTPAQLDELTQQVRDAALAALAPKENGHGQDGTV